MLKQVKNNTQYLFWYAILPVFTIMVAFSLFFTKENVFIGGYQDTLSNVIQYIFLDRNYFAKWNNLWIMGGFPEYASPFSDKYYPISFPFYYLTKSIYILNFVILLHLFIAYLTTFKLGSLVTQNKYLLSIGALFFVFSGVVMSRVSIGQNYYIYALAWLPLLFYLFFLIFWKKDTRVENFIFLTVTAILIFLSAGLYYFIFSLMIMTIFIIYYLVKQKIYKEIIFASIGFLCLFLMLVSFKLIPDMMVTNYLVRLDPIDPLSGGGFIEKDIASFVFGTPIENFYGMHESLAFIGLIPALFIIIALIFGERDLTVPAFFSIAFSFIWAAGSNSFLYFIHLFPLLNSFRVPGRIFGALTPLLVLLMVYGVYLSIEWIYGKRAFSLDAGTRRGIILAIAVMVVIKLLELPAQSELSPVSVVSLAVLAIFIGLLYFNKITPKIFIIYSAMSLIISIIMAVFLFTIINPEIILEIAVIAAVLFSVLSYTLKKKKRPQFVKLTCIFLVIALVLTIAVNISYIHPSSPGLETSPAREISGQLAETASANQLLWVLETGWSYQHLDFSYWDTMDNIAPFTAYYAYYLKDSPAEVYTIGEGDYFTLDYVVDTRSLDNGQQNIPEYTFSICDIGIYKPSLVLPNAFVIRNNNLIQGQVTLLTPDKIILTGEFKKGDIALLKSAFYPGWNVNGITAVNVNNLVGAQIQENTGEIVYSFDPLDFKMGVIISAIGIIILIIVAFYRRRINDLIVHDPVNNNIP